jgi:hypothetical protein
MIPWAIQIVSKFLAPFLSTLIIARDWMSKTTTTKVFNTIGESVPSAHLLRLFPSPSREENWRQLIHSLPRFPFASPGLMGMAIFTLSATFLDTNMEAPAVTCISLALFFLAFTTSGFLTSMVSIAPFYTGTTSGLTLFAGSVVSVALPYIVRSIAREVCARRR